MSEKQRKTMWVYQPVPPKFTGTEKTNITQEIEELIQAQTKLRQKVSKVMMRGHRITLYELVEQFHPEDALYTVPLINGKYLEFPYARIVLLDKKGRKCTVDFQRHNSQWMTIYEGTLEECIAQVENDNCWF